MNDTFPAKLSAQLQFLENESARLTAAPADYGVTADEAVAFIALLATAQKTSAELTTIRKRAKAKTLALRTARAAVVTAHRRLAQAARLNADVTNEALSKIGVSRSARPSPKVAPNDPPVVRLETLTDDVAVISVCQPSGRRCRPPTAIAAELSLVDGAQPPVEGEAERGNWRRINRCLMKLPLAGHATSLRLYVRWITQRGHTSPWSLALVIRPQN